MYSGLTASVELIPPDPFLFLFPKLFVDDVNAADEGEDDDNDDDDEGRRMAAATRSREV